MGKGEGEAEGKGHTAEDTGHTAEGTGHTAKDKRHMDRREYIGQ